MSTLKQQPKPSPHQVLDPCLLGRPIHLLPVFTARLREGLAEFFLNINRRYKAAFQVGEVVLARMDGFDTAGRWIAYRASHGQITFSLNRSVLLGVLDCRYGRQGGIAAAAPNDQQGRVTATEERLAMSLGLQLTQAVAATIDALDHATACVDDFAAVPATPPRSGAWTISVAVQDVAAGVDGYLWFALDEAWMSRLLRNLAPPRDKLSKQAAVAPPLATQLQLKLTAHLARKEILLGDLLNIRVGDVIPVTVNRTDVVLNDARLFTAAVAEHHGKLCLTFFEDVE